MTIPIGKKEFVPDENLDPEEIAQENDRLLMVAHAIFAESGSVTTAEIVTRGRVSHVKAIEILQKFNQYLALEKIAKGHLKLVNGQ